MMNKRSGWTLNYSKYDARRTVDDEVSGGDGVPGGEPSESVEASD